ncbi:MAG: methionyl-tRNA formyltransferase [Mycoplasma sp.]
MHKPRIAFFGTPWIAQQCLEELLLLDIDLVCVVCQPDKQKDRKGNIINCAVKEFALNKNITVHQPEKIDQLHDVLKDLNLDLIVTCAYGQFVTTRILELPKYGCVNLHASLLPKLRGGAPIHWAIINNEKETGISLMYMVKKMDAGNVLFQNKTNISETDTYDTLLIKLANLAREMISQNILKTLDKNIVSIEQNELDATFGYNIKKSEELIDFNKSVELVDCQVRGLYSKPMAKVNLDGNIFKIHSCYKSNIISNSKPGTINLINKDGIYVSTNDFDIIITKIQPPNKSAILVKDYINGSHNIKVGTIINEGTNG